MQQISKCVLYQYKDRTANLLIRGCFFQHHIIDHKNMPECQQSLVNFVLFRLKTSDFQLRTKCEFLIEHVAGMKNLSSKFHFYFNYIL